MLSESGLCAEWESLKLSQLVCSRARGARGDLQKGFVTLAYLQITSSKTSSSRNIHRASIVHEPIDFGLLLYVLTPAVVRMCVMRITSYYGFAVSELLCVGSWICKLRDRSSRRVSERRERQ